MRLREPFLCIALINLMTTHVLASSEKNPELEKLLSSGREAYKVRQRGEYKKRSNSVAAFDEGGKQIGIVFETATTYFANSLNHKLA